MTECFVHSAVVGLILENAQPGNKAGNKKGQSGHLSTIGNNTQFVTGFKIINKVWIAVAIGWHLQYVLHLPVGHCVKCAVVSETNCVS